MSVPPPNASAWARGLVAALAVASWPGAVLAQAPIVFERDDPDIQPELRAEARFDEYSVVSEKMLLLEGEPDSTLSASELAQLVGQFDLRRFDRSVAGSDPNSEATRAWCDRAVADTQRIRGEVDAQGDPIITLAAMLERCSQVFRLTIGARHRCDRYRDREGDLHARCEVRAEASLEKFRAESRSDGIALVPDPSFEDRGRFVAVAANTASAQVSRSPTVATREARAGAARGAGTALWLQVIQQVEAFELRAPVTANRGGWTLSCLGRDTVSLDTPFLVIRPGTDEEVGFVKARRIHDGCTRTADHGDDAVLEPMASENILGGGSIRPGMNLRELPSAGIAVGAHIGSAPLWSEAIQPTAGARVEINTARFSGVSELHAVLLGRLTLATSDRLSEDQDSRFQIDIGLLKRFYLAGPLFFELAGYLTSTILGGERESGDDEEYIQTFGVSGAGGLGLQLSPRWTARLTGGYRVASGFSVFPDEGGPTASLDILYGF